ncbi:MAG: ribosomal protein L7/L12 [bacterium]
MTDQQERMLGEVLSTVRSLQKCDNHELVSILGRIADGVLNDTMNGLFKVMLTSTMPDNGDDSRSKKIQVIKILREYSGLGLKEAKDILDQTDSNMGLPVKLLDKMSAEKAHKMADEIRALGLDPTVAHM